MINFVWHQQSRSAHRYLNAVAAHPTRVTTLVFFFPLFLSRWTERGLEGWEMNKEHPVLCWVGLRPSCSDGKSWRRLANANSQLRRRLTRTSYMAKVTSKPSFSSSCPRRSLLSGGAFGPGAFYKPWPDQRRGEQVSSKPSGSCGGLNVRAGRATSKKLRASAGDICLSFLFVLPPETGHLVSQILTEGWMWALPRGLSTSPWTSLQNAATCFQSHNFY